MELDLKKYIPFAIITALIIFSLVMLKDIFVAIISAFVLAFMIRPLYKKLNRKLPRFLSGITCVLVIILIIIIPAIIIVSSVLVQFSQSLETQTLRSIISSLSELPIVSQLNLPIDEITQKSISLTISFLQNALSQIPQVAVTILIMAFGTYYFLLDWEKITAKLKSYLPTKNKEHLAKKIQYSAKNIIYGTLLIAALEFLIAGVAFWLLGIDFAFVYATLIAIFAFIPGLGPLIVWIPLAIYLIYVGSFIKASIVIALGLFLSAYIDGILRAQIAGKKSNIHPFIILIGIIGGISVFGIFGFIIGPITLVITLDILDEITNRNS